MDLSRIPGSDRKVLGRALHNSAGSSEWPRGSDDENRLINYVEGRRPAPLLATYACPANEPGGAERRERLAVRTVRSKGTNSARHTSGRPPIEKAAWRTRLQNPPKSRVPPGGRVLSLTLQTYKQERGRRPGWVGKWEGAPTLETVAKVFSQQTPENALHTFMHFSCCVL